nr:heparinase [Acetatifactor sp.]
MNKEDIKNWLDRYQNQIRSDAEELLDMQMPEVSEELFAIFEKTGSRIEYEEVYCERRKFLSVFGCMTILDSAEKYRRKLEAVIRNVCEEECWALPAHVNRASDLDWRNCVDLLASETANILAELSTLLRERLSDDIHILIRENIQKRIFDPYLSRKPYATWENCEMNWNAVCNGNIGGAAIYLLQDKPEVLNQLLERVCDNLVHYLNGFSEEGVCKEGLSYYT